MYSSPSMPVRYYRTALLLGGLLCAISLWHLFSSVRLPIPLIGVLWLGSAAWFLLTISKPIGSIWVTGYFIGLWVVLSALGPFLSPPTDPLEHLRASWALCSVPDGSVFPKINDGFWHYSLNALFICPLKGMPPLAILWGLHALHGFYAATLLVALWAVSRSAGLNSAWATFSVLVAFSFFGTNRFSYFSYYSFGPGFSSMLVYWLWIAWFAFERPASIAKLWLSAAVFFPFLLINHLQEFFFLAFAVFLLSALTWVEQRTYQKKPRFVAAIIVTLVGPLAWIPTTQEFLRLGLNELHMLFFAHTNLLWVNQERGLLWPASGLAITTNPLGWRISDTLALIGFSPLVLGPIAWFLGFFRTSAQGVRVFIISSLPLILFFMPLFAIGWASLSDWTAYHRFAYAGLPWLFVAWFFQACSERIPYANLAKVIPNISQKVWRRGGYVFFLLLVVILGDVRSSPFYGKLDFLTLPSAPWWPTWRPMIEQIASKPEVTYVTDPTTSTVLQGVFGLSASSEHTQFRELTPRPLSASFLTKASQQAGSICLVNRLNFDPTWVPAETGHWDPQIAAVAAYYPSSHNEASSSAWLNGCQVFDSAIK